MYLIPIFDFETAEGHESSNFSSLFYFPDTLNNPTVAKLTLDILKEQRTFYTLHFLVIFTAVIR